MDALRGILDLRKAVVDASPVFRAADMSTEFSRSQAVHSSDRGIRRNCTAGTIYFITTTLTF